MVNAIEEVLHQHRFVVLPIGPDGTRLALRHYDHNGIACCDALAFREANGGGQALRDEAALLTRSLPQLSQQLTRGPHVSSAFRQKVISFLGRKTHILCNSEGQPLRCQLYLLLIIPNSSRNLNDEPLPTEITVVTFDQLDQYLSELANNSPARLPRPSKWLVPLRRSYKLLGGAVLLTPFLLGLSGLLSSLGSGTAAALAAITSGVVPLMLVFLAFQSFRTFQQNHIYSPTVVTPLTTTIPCSPAGSSIETIATTVTRPSESPDTAQLATSWNSSNSSAFLSQSVHSAMAASLSAYRTEKWESFAGHIRSFLLSGLRLSVLQRTGQMPQGEPETLVNMLSLGDSRTELESWLQRLSTKNQGEILTIEEAKIAGNYVVSLLLRLQAIPPSSEEQFFRIIPRLASVPPISTSMPEPSPMAPNLPQEELQSHSRETAEFLPAREEDGEYPEQQSSAGDSPPSSPQIEASPSPDLLVEADVIIEEVTTARASNPRRRAIEVDIETAQQRRELAPLVPVALAVVRLPEDQSLLDNMEAALQQEEYLVAEFVDLTRNPSASEVLQLSRGSVRLRFDERERVLKSPKTDHLLANIQQIRALKIIPSLNGDAKPDTQTVQTTQSASVSSKSKRTRQEKQKPVIVAAR